MPGTFVSIEGHGGCSGTREAGGLGVGCWDRRQKCRTPECSEIGPRLAVDEQEILPAVIVVVDERAACAHRLGHVLLSLGSVDVLEADPRGGRRIREEET